MKNYELYQFMDNYGKLKTLSGFPFVFELARNKRKIVELISTLEEIKEELPEYKEFKSKYLALREKYSDRDKSGNPITEDVPGQPGMKNYKITEKAKEFAVEEAKIEKKYKNILDQQKKRWVSYNEALEQDVNEKFVCVSEQNIPKNISLEQLELVSFMICEKKGKSK
jgi:predicted nuclease with TOPRIM domain